jgi:hypothetical protein
MRLQRLGLPEPRVERPRRRTNREALERHTRARKGEQMAHTAIRIPRIAPAENRSGRKVG